jgi:hypothetical protein
MIAAVYLRPRRVVLLVDFPEFGRRLQRHADGASQQSIERIHPEHLALKHNAKVARDGFGHGVEIEFAPEFALHRGHRLRGDPAGDDQVEVAEVGVYVEGEAVRGDEAGDVHADGGELGFCSGSARGGTDAFVRPSAPVSVVRLVPVGSADEKRPPLHGWMCPHAG